MRGDPKRVEVSPYLLGPHQSEGAMQKRKFTREELSQFNGKNSKPAFVACEGKVYDVTGSFLWQKGRHQAMHYAGLDLSESMKQAPHGTEFLERFRVVGSLGEK